LYSLYKGTQYNYVDSRKNTISCLPFYTFALINRRQVAHKTHMCCSKVKIHKIHWFISFRQVHRIRAGTITPNTKTKTTIIYTLVKTLRHHLSFSFFIHTTHFT
jgi:hypothetical protein